MFVEAILYLLQISVIFTKMKKESENKSYTQEKQRYDKAVEACYAVCACTCSIVSGAKQIQSKYKVPELHALSFKPYNRVGKWKHFKLSFVLRAWYLGAHTLLHERRLLSFSCFVTGYTDSII